MEETSLSTQIITTPPKLPSIQLYTTRERSKPSFESRCNHCSPCTISPQPSHDGTNHHMLVQEDKPSEYIRIKHSGQTVERCYLKIDLADHQNT